MLHVLATVQDSIRQGTVHCPFAWQPKLYTCLQALCNRNRKRLNQKPWFHPAGGSTQSLVQTTEHSSRLPGSRLGFTGARGYRWGLERLHIHQAVLARPHFACLLFVFKGSPYLRPANRTNTPDELKTGHCITCMGTRTPNYCISTSQTACQAGFMCEVKT